MASLTDRQRIEAMREAGTISPEEARMLLEAIGEATPPATPLGAPTPAHTDGVMADTTAAAPSSPEGAHRWCSVKLFAGEVEVEAADLDKPVLVEGDGFALEPEGEGVRLIQTRGVGFEVFGVRFARKQARAVLRLPRDWGLALDIKAGDVATRNVRWVRGQMLAGDVRLVGAEWVDLIKLAGDIEADLRPIAGVQRIESRAGDLSVRLLPGSDVRVSAEVTNGELKAPGFTVHERAVGARAERVFGTGTAELRLSLTVGDLEVHAVAEEVPQ